MCLREMQKMQFIQHLFILQKHHMKFMFGGHAGRGSQLRFNQVTFAAAQTVKLRK